MHFPRTLAALALVAITTVTSACGEASQVPVTVPDNIANAQAEQPGPALTPLGYTIVSRRYNNGQPVGYVYVACGTENNITKCGRDHHNRGTNQHPNVYTANGKIIFLEGPHTSEYDDRSYYIEVPAAYQDFAALKPEQQTALLGIMPEVAKTLGNPTEGGYENRRVLVLSIGQVNAWVARP